MTETILSLLLVSSFIYHYLYVLHTQKQINTFIKAFMARDLPELDASIISEASRKKPADIQVESEYIPAEDMDDDLFKKVIDRELHGEDR